MIVYQMLYNIIWFTTCRSIPKYDYYFATIYTTLVYYPTLLHNMLDNLSTPSIQNKTSRHIAPVKQYFLYHSIQTTTNPPITQLYTNQPCYSFYLYHLTAQQNSATLLVKQVFDVWQISSTCDNYTN